MDENSLYSLRRDPPEEFARKLKASLQRGGARAGSGRGRVGKIAAFAASCVVMAAAFAVPSVRDTAQAFLDMFRVVNFAAVPVGSQALQQLRHSKLDFKQLIGDEVQVIQESGPPTPYPTPEEAGVAAGFHVYLPSWMPVGWNTETPAVEVVGPHAARITANTARLREVLAALQIDDVTVPEGLDGKSATVQISPAVAVKWQHAGQTVQLLQSPSPQVDFPAGADLPALGQIGLRILGLSRNDAYRIAQSIDWRTTLVVPVPTNAVSFRQVAVQGNSGLLMETAAAPAGEAGRHRDGAVLLWSARGRVFALSGTLGPVELVEMAQTLQ